MKVVTIFSASFTNLLEMDENCRVIFPSLKSPLIWQLFTSSKVKAKKMLLMELIMVLVFLRYQLILSLTRSKTQ